MTKGSTRIEKKMLMRIEVMLLDVALLCFRESRITRQDIVGERTNYERYVMVHIDQ